MCLSHGWWCTLGLMQVFPLMLFTFEYGVFWMDLWNCRSYCASKWPAQRVPTCELLFLETFSSERGAVWAGLWCFTYLVSYQPIQIVPLLLFSFGYGMFWMGLRHCSSCCSCVSEWLMQMVPLLLSSFGYDTLWMGLKPCSVCCVGKWFLHRYCWRLRYCLDLFPILTVYLV